MHSGTTMTAKPEVITGTLRMLKDKILLKPIEWDASSVIIALRSGRPVRGIVVAIGPGCYPKIYSRDRSKCWDSKVFRPTQITPGDVVELGGLNAFDGAGYSFDSVIYEGTPHLICTEKDVCGVRV